MTQILFILAILPLVFGDYDHELSEDIFQYSRAAYCSADIIERWDCEPCQRHKNILRLQVFHNDSADAQGYCGYDIENNRVILAIRGSVSTKNYINDLNYFKMDYPGCKKCGVHNQFYKTYLNLANNLLACAYTLHNDVPDAPIWVTGHSLGAAQAVFAALEVKALLGVDTFGGFIIYGTPRIGNDEFAAFVEQELGKNVYRVVRDRDIFQHAPTQTINNFTHFANEIFYDEKMENFKVCSGREDTQCAGKYFWTWQWKLDHHLYYFKQCSGCTLQGCDNL
ncbi:hypothetical protein pb186bvf_012396 [Paramecium bursaria]